MSENERTPFDDWQDKTNGLVCDRTDKHPGDFDAQGPIVEQAQKEWFAEGMGTEEAADRTILLMARHGALKDPITFVVFPELPEHDDDESFTDPRIMSGYYEVVNVDEAAAYYHSSYYRSVDEVIIDLKGRIEAGEVSGKWGSDFVIWRDGRILAAIHEPMQGSALKVVRFTERRNDPGGSPVFWDGWPSREEWIASGRGPLTFDPLKAERQRRAREEEGN